MKKLIIILLGFLPVVFYGQNMDIVWQQCYGTSKCDDSPDFIFRTDNGYYISTTIICTEDGITDFHGGSDPWLVFTDTLHNIQWEKCYGGSGGDSFTKMLKAKNNQHWVLAGTNSNDGDIQSYNHESYDIWILRLDSVGNILFEKCYGSYYNYDRPMDIITMPDGGAIILGSIDGAGGDISTHYGSTDAWVFRIDSIGNILWEKTYGNESVNDFASFIPTSKGTFMLAGWTYSGGGMITCDVDSSDNYKDCWILEIDEYGEILWQGCYGGSYNEQAMSIAETNDGYIIAGFSNSDDIDVSGLHDEGGEHEDFWVYKIDNEGELVWQNCLGGSDTDFASNVFIDNNGDIIVFGDTWSGDGDVTVLHGETASDIWVVKLDSVGNLLNQRSYGSSGYEHVSRTSVTKIDDYNYVLSTGNTDMDGDVECHLGPIPWTGRDNWVFQLKDCSHYAPTQPQQPTGKDTLCVNTDSITIYTTIPTTFAWYYEWQLQPEEAGTITTDSIITTVNWNPNYEGPATLKVRSTNDCGESTWSDSLVIQTYMCLGTEENTIAGNLRVYPNPATNTLIVELETHKQQPSSLEIYNSTGARVYSAHTTNTKTTVDVSSWSRGIYIVKVISENKNHNKKVVVK